MPASRGMMTRAASALLFAATLGFSLAFPGSAAESPEGAARPLTVSNAAESPKAEVAGESDRVLAPRTRDFPGVSPGGELGARGVADIVGPLIDPGLTSDSTGNVEDTAANCTTLGGTPVSAPGSVSGASPPAYCVGGAENAFCVIKDLSGFFPCYGAVEGALFNHIRNCNELNLTALDNTACGGECETGLTARGAACLVVNPSGEEADTVDMGVISSSVTFDSNGNVEDTAANCMHLGGTPVSAPGSVSGANPPAYCVGAAENAFCVIEDLSGFFPCYGAEEGALFNHVVACNRENRKALDNTACGNRCQNGLLARGAQCIPPLNIGPTLPPPPPECIRVCEPSAVIYDAVQPGGVLSVHDEDGNEIPSGDRVRERTLLTLTAEPADDSWYVAGWTGCDGGETGSSGDGAAVKRCLVYMPSDTLNVSVSFRAARGQVLYDRFVTDLVDGDLVVVGQLSAFSGGVSVVNGALLDVGTPLTMEAIPQDDFYVESWSGPCAGVGEVGSADGADRVQECVLTIFGGMRQIGANFASKPREEVDPTIKDDTVTIVVVDPGPPVMTVTLTGPTNVVVGRTIIIEANPDDGMCVSEWTGACGGGVGETGCIGEADERKKCVLVVTPGLDLDDINPVYIPSPKLFNVGYRSEGMGTVSAYSERAVPTPGGFASGGAVMEDARVSFLAVPEAGYYVGSWSGVCAGAAIGDKTAPGPDTGGRSCHWVADRNATGADEVVARFVLAPRDEYTREEIDDALPQNRTATRGAVVGYQGPILTVTAGAGSSLVFVPASSGGLEVDARGVVRSQGAVNGPLRGEFTATLVRVDREPREVALDVLVSPVRPPVAPAAVVALQGDGVSGPPQERPFGYDTGGVFSQGSHAGQAHFNVDENTGAITGDPPVGTYTIPIEFTHSGFAGVIRLDAEVRIVDRGAGVPRAQLFPGGNGRIYLANGFQSRVEIHRMVPDGADVEITKVNNNSNQTSQGAVRARIENGIVVFETSRSVADTVLFRGGIYIGGKQQDGRQTSGFDRDGGGAGAREQGWGQASGDGGLVRSAGGGLFAGGGFARESRCESGYSRLYGCFGGGLHWQRQRGERAGR